MERVIIDEVEAVIDAATLFRPLSAALDTTRLAINYYELDRGDSFAYGYHVHEEQEEVFIILSGTATFETEAGEVTVGSDELIRFAPGEYQQGWNRGNDRVRAIAIGAPRGAPTNEILCPCEDCGRRTPHSVERDGERERMRTRCDVCGTVTAEFGPAG